MEGKNVLPHVKQAVAAYGDGVSSPAKDRRSANCATILYGNIDM